MAVDVVTAAGEQLHIDKDNNADLLWAAKGAGPGFPAIVTRFHLKVRPKIPFMLSSAFIYPISKYREVMEWVTSITADYDGSTEIVAVATTPEELGQPCIIPLFLTFQQSEAECIKALELANTSRPLGMLVEVVNKHTSIAQEYIDQANANPKQHRYCVDNGYVNNNVDVVKALEPSFTTLPSPKSFALWYAMAPCSRRQMPDMALSMQSDHYFAIYTIWKDEQDDNLCQRWTSGIMKDLAPLCDGAYLGDSDFQVRRPKFWTDQKERRLMDIRRKWDPEGRICGYLGLDDHVPLASTASSDR